MAWKGAAALLLGAMLVSGCGAGSAGGSTQSFVSLVHQMSPDVGTYANDSSLVDLGHAVCDDLSSGASVQQVADRLGSFGAGARLPTGDLGSVMAAASEALCPRYSNLFGSGGPG